jgi:mannosylglycoprotein endo-beta-mannosidase
MSILSSEEEYWRQRGRQNWLLKGDANTAYFHAIANGRRRKCAILSLQSEEGEVFGQLAIQEHIYKFYLDLMGSEEPKFLNLAGNCWNEDGSVSQEENEVFALTFTLEELEEVLQGTKTATAPGPDGLPVAFFKKFWPVLKQWVLQILNDFMLGRIDISRLNFGILSLIPKV